VAQIFLLAILVSATPQQRLPWSLQMRHASQVQSLAYGAVVLDLDDDGVDEFVAQDPQISNIIYDQNGDPVMQVPMRGSEYRCCLGAADINRDGVKDPVFFYRGVSETLFVTVLMSGRSRLDYVTFPFRGSMPYGEWLGSVSEGTFLDVDDNGVLDLLVPIFGGFSLRPRGVFAMDLLSGKILWEFRVASAPYKIVLVDLNSDGYDEIVVLTWAPCNGVKYNGFDDCSSRVFVLSKTGKLIAQREVGTYFTTPDGVAIDIEGDGNTELVVCEQKGSPKDTTSSHIHVFRGDTLELVRFVPSRHKLDGFDVSDFDRDGKLDVLVGTSDGKLLRYDAKLEIVEERSFDTAPLELLQTIDLDGNGTSEILVRAGTFRLLILNDRLEPILSEWIAPNAEIFPLRNAESYRILASMGEGFALFDIRKTFPIVGYPLQLSIAAASLAIVVIIIAFLWHSISASTKLVSSISLPLMRVSRRRTMRPANEIARSIFGDRDLSLVQLPSRELPYKPYPLSVMGKKYLVLREVRNIDVKDRAIAWAGMAQRLAHDFKNPLSVLMLTTQRLGSKLEGKESESYVTTLMEELQKLRVRVDGFMRFLSLTGPEFAPTDLKGLLVSLKERFGRNLPEDVSIALDLDPGISSISADEGQLRDALTNVIDNALTAVGSQGHVTIRAAMEERIEGGSGEASQIVEIEISDDGPGIPEDDQEKLFTPYFTTRPSGTGLGLVITKRIVEDHGGTIRIESTPGIGTKVAISLPVSREGANA
jgi:signal transduction histidine kinase